MHQHRDMLPKDKGIAVAQSSQQRPQPWLRPPWVLGVWLLVYALLLGCTLPNTYPYQGDESFYTVAALRMVQDGQYMIPYYFDSPRLQKPILMYWLIAASYNTFGISLWSARLPALLLAGLTQLLVYGLATWYMPDRRFGVLAVLLLSSTALFMTFSRIAMTDPLLTFFTTAALWCFAAAVRHAERPFGYHACGYVAMALAFMSKGPAGLLPLAGYMLFLLVLRPTGYRRLLLAALHPCHIVLLVLLVAPWYGYIYLAHGADMMRHMRQESKAFTSGIRLSTMGLHVLFYVYVLVVCFVPFTVIAAGKMLRHRLRMPQELMLPVLYSATVMLFFTVFVREHKDRYLYLMFPALTLVIAYILYTTSVWRRYAVTAVAITGAMGTAFILYPLVSGEALRQVVTAWQQRQDGTLGLYKLETKRTGWALLMAGGQAHVNSTATDYVITDQQGAAELPGFQSVLAATERERLNWQKGRPVLVNRTYHLLRRVTP